MNDTEKEIRKQQTEKAAMLLEKCCRILKAEKIPVSDRISEIKINTRAKARFGKCTQLKKGYEIEISSRLFALEDKMIENVILHELLHTCPGCMNHGKRWKAYAAYINRKYDYTITVKTSYETLGLDEPEKNIQVKYMIRCTRCGASYPRQRMCRLVENVDRYVCGKCGGKLEIQ